MEKKEKIKKANSSHPWKYPRETVECVLTLIKQQKSMEEILAQVPCKKSAVRRYARKAGLTIKK